MAMVARLGDDLRDLGRTLAVRPRGESLGHPCARLHRRKARFSPRAARAPVEPSAPQHGSRSTTTRSEVVHPQARASASGLITVTRRPRDRPLSSRLGSPPKEFARLPADGIVARPTARRRDRRSRGSRRAFRAAKKLWRHPVKAPAQRRTVNPAGTQHGSAHVGAHRFFCECVIHAVLTPNLLFPKSGGAP